MAISGDFPAMGPGCGAHTAYIHEMFTAILKWTRDDNDITVQQRKCCVEVTSHKSGARSRSPNYVQ